MPSFLDPVPFVNVSLSSWRLRVRPVTQSVIEKHCPMLEKIPVLWQVTGAVAGPHLYHLFGVYETGVTLLISWQTERETKEAPSYENWKILPKLSRKAQLSSSKNSYFTAFRGAGWLMSLLLVDYE